MDHDARGDCRAEQPLKNLENAFWAADPPPGEYRVELAYWGPCGDHGAANTTVSISVGGRVVGVFNYTLEPEQRVQLATFSL